MNRGVYVVSLIFIAVVVGIPLILIGTDPQGSLYDLFGWASTWRAGRA